MQKMKQHKKRMHQRTAGLSLVEVLISLAIVAMLLTATGIAFDAALKNYKINHDMASVSVSARNALYQMTSTLRSAWNLDPGTDPNAAIYVATDGKRAVQCSMPVATPVAIAITKPQKSCK